MGMRVYLYLYVDGENFTIRAQRFDAELKENSGQAAGLRERVKLAVGFDPPTTVRGMAMQWSPDPHRDVLLDPTRTQNGIHFTRDEATSSA